MAGMRGRELQATRAQQSRRCGSAAGYMKVQSLILVLLLPWLVQAQQQYYGTRLSTMTLAGAGSQDDLQVLAIHPGDILTPENVRASIQALYDTGHYSHIVV